MQSYHVHESVYFECEIHSPLVRGLDLEWGKYGFIVKMPKKSSLISRIFVRKTRYIVFIDVDEAPYVIVKFILLSILALRWNKYGHFVKMHEY